MQIEKSMNPGGLRRDIDKTSGVPYYLQLADIIEHAIETGEFPRGSALASEREICERWDVSRATARQAVAHLRSKKIVQTQRGIGTRVVDAPRIERDLLGFHNFDIQLAEKGHTSEIVVIDFDNGVCSPAVAEALQLTVGSRTLDVTRLRLADQRPLFNEQIHLPWELFSDLTREDFESLTLFQNKIQSQRRLRLGEVAISIEPVLLTDEERALLEVDVAPAAGLLNERITYADTGVPICFSRWIFSAERCRHTLKARPNMPPG